MDFEETKKFIEDSIIPGTISKRSGYAHVVVSCDFKPSEELRQIPTGTLARHLDGYAGNFGYGYCSLRCYNEDVWHFEAKIYTD